jgi:hypothetical protein
VIEIGVLMVNVPVILTASPVLVARCSAFFNARSLPLGGLDGLVEQTCAITWLEIPKFNTATVLIAAKDLINLTGVFRGMLAISFYFQSVSIIFVTFIHLNETIWQQKTETEC